MVGDRSGLMLPHTEPSHLPEEFMFIVSGFPCAVVRPTISSYSPQGSRWPLSGHP
jgi:hypothetical protein